MKQAPLAIVIGTRPEAVKMAPVCLQLRDAGLPFTVVSTGQQRELCRRALRVFGLAPDIDLALMRRGQEPGEILARAIERLLPLYSELKTRRVVVQGDTTSALAGALAAAQAGLPVAHVEAGLRSHDFARPYPEELNRVFIDRLAELHFAPTRRAAANLRRERLLKSRIYVTGNTVVDAAELILQKPWRPTTPALRRFLAHDGEKALLTAHRRESLGAPLAGIFEGARRLLKIRRDLVVLYPVHLNPRVRRQAAGFSHVRLIKTPPLAYPDFLHAAAACGVILSDSGGVQEEAPSLGVPVVLLRDVNDRPEGTARLVGTSPSKIARAAQQALKSRRPKKNPFGDGKAAARIVKILRRKARR